MNEQKKALICGISGQDGAYLAKLLLSKNYKVIGTSRDAQASSFSNLEKLGIKNKIEYKSMALNDFRSVLQVLSQSNPHEVYNLAGQTSVSLSFEQPVEALESISIGTINLLEAIRFLNRDIRFYNAGSSECFGDTGSLPANENTQFRPSSPYAVAKAAAYWQVSSYRNAYNMFTCSGILFNHESLLRSERFVTQKIIQGVKRISAGRQAELMLGRLDIQRDWGWAPEYVIPMWQMLQQECPQDFVIATGKSYTLQHFVKKAFEKKDLDWQRYVVINTENLRPVDALISKADPSLAESQLGWKASMQLEDIIEKMINSEI